MQLSLRELPSRDLCRISTNYLGSVLLAFPASALASENECIRQRTIVDCAEIAMNDSTPPVSVIDSPSSSQQGQESPPRESVVGWLRATVPTGLVIVVLAGLAYWGHHTDWNFGGKQDRAQTPASEPIQVLEGNDTPSRAWCPKHGVHDCPFENPELAQTEKPAVIVPEDLERATRALALRPRPSNDPNCIWHPRRLRVVDPDAASKLGLDVAPVWREAITEVAIASGEISFDPTFTANLAARAPGTARFVAKTVGDSVAAGEILAVVDAREVGKAKAELLDSLVQARLKRKYRADLKGAGAAIPERQIQEAEAALRNAEARLLAAEQALINLGLPVRAADLANTPTEEMARRLEVLGIPDSLQRTLDSRSRTANLLPLRAPFAGVVLRCEVITGELVDTNKALFVVVDPRRVWLTLHVSPDDARYVAVGQTVTFRPDGLKDEFSGRLTWVGTSSDEKTRTLPVRVELANDTGRLRAASLGVGRIVLRESPDAMVVPSEAVQSDGHCEIVFVRHKDYLKSDGPKEFFVRSVRTGVRQGPNTEILAGLLPGEVVVTKGSARLLSRMKEVTSSR